VLSHPQFELAVQEVDTFNVCFWIIPEKLKRGDFGSD
jgi:hypothetical protein